MECVGTFNLSFFGGYFVCMECVTFRFGDHFVWSVYRRELLERRFVFFGVSFIEGFTVCSYLDIPIQYAKKCDFSLVAEASI